MESLIDTTSQISYADIGNAIFAISMAFIGYLIAKRDNNNSFRNQLRIKIYERLADQIWKLHNTLFKLNATAVSPPLILMRGTGILHPTTSAIFKHRSDLWLGYTKKISDEHAEFARCSGSTWRLVEDWQVLFPKLQPATRALFNEEVQKFSEAHQEFVRRMQSLHVTDYDSWDHEAIRGDALEYGKLTGELGIFIEDFVAMFANVTTRNLGRHQRSSRNFTLEQPVKYRFLSKKGVIEKKWWGKNRLRNMWRYYVKKEEVFEE